MKVSPFVTTVAGFLAGVGTTQALALSNRAISISLSNQCQNAVIGIAGNPDASACLNTKTLIAAVLTSQQANTSVVPTINTFLEGICAAAPCSNATLTAIAANLTSGCQSDLAAAGGGSLTSVVQDLPQIYPSLRQILCLKTPSNDTLCASNLLLGFQDIQGSPLTLSSATSTIAQVTGQATNGSLPSGLLCTDCSRAALSIVAQNDPSIGSNSQFQSTVASQCGSNFLSSPSPTDVVEGTGTAAPTGTLPPHLISSGSGNNTTNGATAILAGAFASTSIALFAGLYTLVV